MANRDSFVFDGSWLKRIHKRSKNQIKSDCLFQNPLINLLLMISLCGEISDMWYQDFKSFSKIAKQIITIGKSIFGVIITSIYNLISFMWSSFVKNSPYSHINMFKALVQWAKPGLYSFMASDSYRFLFISSNAWKAFALILAKFGKNLIISLTCCKLTKSGSLFFSLRSSFESWCIFQWKQKKGLTWFLFEFLLF